MPEAAILDASGTLVSSGVVGAFLVLVLAALVWVTRQWLLALRALDAEKDARLDDAKEAAAIGEVVRNAMAANTTAINSVLEIVRDRGRT